VVIVGFVAFGCASNEDESDLAKKRCGSLRDHLIDMRLEMAAVNGRDLKEHRAALQQALGTDFVESCQQRPMSEIKCALAAKDTSSVAACSSSQ
jgi:hypothetical protein